MSGISKGSVVKLLDSDSALEPRWVIIKRRRGFGPREEATVLAADDEAEV